MGGKDAMVQEGCVLLLQFALNVDVVAFGFESSTDVPALSDNIGDITKKVDPNFGRRRILVWMRRIIFVWWWWS